MTKYLNEQNNLKKKHRINQDREVRGSEYSTLLFEASFFKKCPTKNNPNILKIKIVILLIKTS